MSVWAYPIVCGDKKATRNMTRKLAMFRANVASSKGKCGKLLTLYDFKSATDCGCLADSRTFRVFVVAHPVGVGRVGKVIAMIYHIVFLISRTLLRIIKDTTFCSLFQSVLPAR